MYTAARPYVTAGFVFTGVAVLVVGPIAGRPPSVEIPAPPAPASVAASSIQFETALVELAAQSRAMRAGGPFAALIAAFSNVANDVAGGVDNVAGDVTAAVSTITDAITQTVDDIAANIANLGSGQRLMGDLAAVTAAENSLGAAGNLTALPAAAIAEGPLVALIAAFANITEDVINGVGNVVGDVTQTVSTITDSVIGTVDNLIGDILGSGQMQFSTAAAVTPLALAPQPAGPLVALIRAFGTITEDVITAVSNVVGDVTQTVSTITDSVIGTVDNLIGDILGSPGRAMAAGVATTAPLATVNTLRTTSEVTTVPTVVRHSLTRPETTANPAFSFAAGVAATSSAENPRASAWAVERHTITLPAVKPSNRKN